jgi:hypothetical protein
MKAAWQLIGIIENINGENNGRRHQAASIINGNGEIISYQVNNQ